MKVEKRDGHIVEFDMNKVKNALKKSGITSEVDLHRLLQIVKVKLGDRHIVTVSDIQKEVETTLMQEGYYDIARGYISYRYLHDVAREKYEKLNKTVKEKIFASNVKNSNANVDERSFGGRKGEMANTILREFSLNNCMSEMARNNHLNNEIYQHDLDSYALGIHNCADGHSWIKIKHKGVPRVTTIKDFSEMIGLGIEKIADLTNAGYEILSRDGWTKLKNISCRRLKDGETLYTIYTRNGIPIKLTGGHRLPIEVGGKEVLKEVKDLVVGDRLLDTESTMLSSEEISSSFLDLTLFNDDKIDIRIYRFNCIKYYLRYKYGVNFGEYAEKMNFKLPHKGKYLALSDFKKIMNDYPLSFDILSQLRIKSRGSKHDFPLFVPYTKELAKVYAYIYADGGIYINEKESLYQLTFTNTNEEMMKDFVNCYESCFGYRLNISYPNEKSTSPCMRVCDGNKLVCKIFKDFAGARKFGANDISMPDFVMNGNDDIKYSYISACIDTDGCLTNSAITYTSCCKRYCEQLCLLLTSLGYAPKVTVGQRAGSAYKFGSKVGKRNFDNHYVKLYRYEDIKDLYSKLSCMKYNDSYAHMGMGRKYNSTEIISIKEDNCANSLVYDMETQDHWYIINNYVSHNCLNLPIDKLFKNGFITRQVDIRPAQSINTAFQLLAVVFQVQSLSQFGGVAATHIDWSMIPYVRKSFYKHYKTGKKYLCNEEFVLDGIEDISINNDLYKKDEKAYKYAYDMTVKELNQAVEGMYHNLNSLQSRSGNQLPFSSINYGTCTLDEGRLVIKALLDASIKGVGRFHKTSVFPCGVFQCMKGVNRKKGEPNYDLFRLALKSTAKRLYPNYCNVDWSVNAGYDKNNPSTYNSTMGKCKCSPCKTYMNQLLTGCVA